MKRFRLMQVMAAAMALATIAFIALGVESSRDYAHVLHSENLGLLAAALALSAVAVVGFGAVWGALLRGLAPNVRTESAMRVFLYTWLARYVPGTVPYHAARVLAAEKLGTSKGMVAASIGYESVLVIGGAAFVGVMGLLIGASASMASAPLYAIAAVCIAAAPLALQSRVLVPAANRLMRLAGKTQINKESIPSGRRLLALFAAYAGVLCVNGAGFYLVVRAVAPEQDVNVALAIGAYNLAGAAGIAALFVPSGLGVREGVIVALLGGTLGTETALVAAGVARAVSIFGDVLPPLALGAFDLARRVGRRAHEVPTVAFGQERHA